RLRLGARLPDRPVHPRPVRRVHQSASQRRVRGELMREPRRYRIFIHVAAVVVSLIFLAPFAWLAIASVSSPVDLLQVPLKWIPSHITFSRYEQIFSASGENIFANFRAALVNSLIVASATVAISMSVGVF